MLHLHSGRLLGRNRIKECQQNDHERSCRSVGCDGGIGFLSIITSKRKEGPLEAILLLIGGIIGFLSSVFTEPVKNYFWGPKLHLEFNPQNDTNNDDFATVTKEGNPVTGTPASYIRVLVTNQGKGLAKHCQAYLVNIEVWNTSRKCFESADYYDSIQLAWSASPNKASGETAAYDPIDIPYGVKKYVDVVSVRESSPNIRLHWKVQLNRLVEILKKKGKFRFSIQVAGDNLTPQLIKIVFDWNGVWNQYKVKKE
jgi:hypothetical protein